VDSSRKKPRLVLNIGSVFPSNLRNKASMVVEYVTGFGSSPSDVPAPIRQAVLIILANLYERRGDEVGGGLLGLYGMIPSNAKAMLDPYRCIEV